MAFTALTALPQVSQIMASFRLLLEETFKKTSSFRPRPLRILFVERNLRWTSTERPTVLAMGTPGADGSATLALAVATGTVTVRRQPGGTRRVKSRASSAPTSSSRPARARR